MQFFIVMFFGPFIASFLASILSVMIWGCCRVAGVDVLDCDDSDDVESESTSDDVESEDESTSDDDESDDDNYNSRYKKRYIATGLCRNKLINYSN